MTKAIDVADYIIEVSQEKGHPVSNLMLQKTMYFLHAIRLVESKCPLIDEDCFEKWTYGPVVKSVYDEYSSYGSNTISKPDMHMFIKTTSDGAKVELRTFSSDNLDSSVRKFIDNNINRFIKKNPFELVELSHKEDQWKDKTISEYSDDETMRFYDNPTKRFWEHS